MMRLSPTDYGVLTVCQEFYKVFAMSALVNFHSISMAPLTPQPSLARLWADTGRAAKVNFFSSDVIA